MSLDVDMFVWLKIQCCSDLLPGMALAAESRSPNQPLKHWREANGGGVLTTVESGQGGGECLVEPVEL